MRCVLRAYRSRPHADGSIGLSVLSEGSTEPLMVDVGGEKKQGMLAKGAFQLVEDEVEELLAEAADAEGLDHDEDEEEDADEEGEGGGRPRNDPEWQFFDTAKVFVKAGDGGA